MTRILIQTFQNHRGGVWFGGVLVRIPMKNTKGFPIVLPGFDLTLLGICLTPYAFDKKTPNFAQGLDFLRSQVAIYTVFHEESESEVEKCQILEPGGKNRKNLSRNSRV